jgi:hypothetical protein
MTVHREAPTAKEAASQGLLRPFFTADGGLGMSHSRWGTLGARGRWSGWFEAEHTDGSSAQWRQRRTGERLDEQRWAEGERDGDDEVENEMVFASMRERIRVVHNG